MENNILNEEINRIFEIMGIPPKKIILEGKEPNMYKVIEPMFEKLLGKAEGTIEKVTDAELKTLEGELKTSITVPEERVKLSKIVEDGTLTPKEKTTKIADLLISNTEVLENLIEKYSETLKKELNIIYDKFFQDYPEVKEDFDALYQTGLELAGDVSKTENFEFAKNAVKEILLQDGYPKQVVDRYFETTEITKNKNTGTYEIKIKDEFKINSDPKIETNDSGLDVENVPPDPSLNAKVVPSDKLTWEQRFKNAVDEVGIGLKNKTLSIREAAMILCRNMGLKSLDNILGFIRNTVFKNTLQKKQIAFFQIVENIKKRTMREGYTPTEYKMGDTKVTITGTGKYGDEYSSELIESGKIIGSIKNYFVAGAPKTIVDDWLNDISKTDPRVKRYFDLSKDFQDVWGVLEREPNIREILSTESKAFKQAWPFTWKIWNKNQGKFFFIDFKGTDWKRFLNFILILDARTVEEWETAFLARGVSKTFLVESVFRFLIHSFIMPVIYNGMAFVLKSIPALGEYLLNNTVLKDNQINLVDYNENKYLGNDINKFIEEDLTDKIWNDWMGALGNPKSKWEGIVNVLPSFLSTIPHDWESLKENSLVDEVVENGKFILKNYFTQFRGIWREEELKKLFDEQIRKGKDTYEKWKKTLTKTQLESIEKFEEIAMKSENVLMQITPDIIYKQFPCYSHCNYGDIADKSKGNQGIESLGPDKFKYYFKNIPIKDVNGKITGVEPYEGSMIVQFDTDIVAWRILDESGQMKEIFTCKQ